MIFHCPCGRHYRIESISGAADLGGGTQRMDGAAKSTRPRKPGWSMMSSIQAALAASSADYLSGLKIHARVCTSAGRRVSFQSLCDTLAEMSARGAIHQSPAGGWGLGPRSKRKKDEE